MLSVVDMITEHYAFLAQQSAEQGEQRTPHMEVYNPGTSNPAFHQRPNASIDQAVATSIASASSVNSDGQEQRLDLDPGRQGVGVIMVPMLAPLAFTGEIQIKSLEHLEQGVRASIGTSPAVDISVSGQSLHVAPLEMSVGTSPAKNVDAGRARLGGLPESFNIK